MWLFNGSGPLVFPLKGKCRQDACFDKNEDYFYLFYFLTKKCLYSLGAGHRIEGTMKKYYENRAQWAQKVSSTLHLPFKNQFS